MLLLLTFVLLQGCNRGTAEVQKTSQEPTVLRVQFANDWVKTRPLIEAVRAFETENPGVKVSMEEVNFRFAAENIGAAIQRGDPPDVVQWHAFAAGATGLAERVDDLWKKHLKEKEFLTGAIEDVTWGGKKYGVPLDTNAMVLLYNAEQFSDVGIPEPSKPLSFAEFRALAKRLTSEDGARKGIALPSSSWRIYGWIRANGGEVVQVGKDGEPVFTLDDPKVIEAVDFLASMIKEGVAFPPASANSSSEAFAIFRSGSAVIHATGSWDLATLQKDQAPGSFKVALLPRGMTGETEGSALGGSSMFVPRGSKNRALAFEFMRHVIKDPYALRFAQEEGRLPARLRVFEKPYFQSPEQQGFLAQLKSAHPFLLEAFPEAASAFTQALNDALQGKKTAKDALHEAQLAAEASPAGSEATP
jgi:multiple sugar transport system substrate-binding protein